MTMIPSHYPMPRAPIAVSSAGGTEDSLAMQQLRHHTKNTLQRLLCQIAGHVSLQHDPASRALARDLERRIHLSASISDALFGLTGMPRSLDARIDSLSRSVVSLMADTDQDIAVTARVVGQTPAGFEDMLIRVAHELVGNAVKHGMALRMIGRIDVAVDACADGVTLTVTDDGWGFNDSLRVIGPAGPVHGPHRSGDGLLIARLLAEPSGGTVTLHRDGVHTVAMLHIPATSLGARQ